MDIEDKVQHPLTLKDMVNPYFMEREEVTIAIQEYFNRRNKVIECWCARIILDPLDKGMNLAGFHIEFEKNKYGV